MTTQLINTPFVAPARFDVEKLPSGKFLSQLNYDGVRFRAGLDGDEVVIRSESDPRGMYDHPDTTEKYRMLNKYIDPVESAKMHLLPVLKSLVERFSDESIIVDGVFPNMNEEERRYNSTDGGMRRDHANTVITDASIPGTYTERLETLLEYIGTEAKRDSTIRLIKSSIHSSKLELDFMYAWYAKNGYLTCLIKDPNAMYGNDSVMRYHEVYLAFPRR